MLESDQLKLELTLSGRQDRIALDGLHRDLRFVKESVAAILENLPVQRKPLSDSVRALHVRVTWERRNGYCPCCQRVPVCDAAGKLLGAEYDHFYARHRNGATETWLICGECNRRLETTHFKASVRSAFEAYQAALRPFLDGGQVPLPTDATGVAQ